MSQHINAASVQLGVTTSNARVQLPLSSLNGVEIVNTGTAAAFIAGGDVTVVANITTCRVVQPNWPRIFSRGEAVDPANYYVAAITAAGAAQLTITPCSMDEQA